MRPALSPQNIRCSLQSAVEKPNASAFLWNECMMLNINCAGYANAQFMQPEPSKYAFAPSLEAKTFMQPEHPYFAHHPGRFFYLKNEQTNEIFSIPFAPCKKPLTKFLFSAGTHSIVWEVEHCGLLINLSLQLAKSKPTEIWKVKIARDNTSVSSHWSLYAYFPLGYMSWMNQSAQYDWQQDALVATYVTPYQRLEDYPSLKDTAQKTFLTCSVSPDAFCASQEAFEGTGGLHNPDALQEELLGNTSAIYQVPCASMQHRINLDANAAQELTYLFGPIHQNAQIAELKTELIDNKTGACEERSFGNLTIKTPDNAFNNFINQWLPRQVAYHSEVNRLTTDPQTRNYLQDNIGNCFINPDKTKQALRIALLQQKQSGEMPDGILLHPDAQLKYINQIPHSDHCVWLPILLEVYCDQTNDVAFLRERIDFADSAEQVSVAEHIERALTFLLSKRDNRGLCFIEQGDWCDPMNMVGAKGKGVSAWLTIAAAYAIKVWLRTAQTYISEASRHDICNVSESTWQQHTSQLHKDINQHCWDKNWYARGITDNNELFGVEADKEGRIYLNPQSWALLAGCADNSQIDKIQRSVVQHLQTPFGNMMLSPSYTKMDERIGRLTQKHIGSAENGSVYNHAFVFWIYAMFEAGFARQGYLNVKEMIDATASPQSGQLPIYVPNYFRGAYHQAPEMTGKSSHLFNTGTAAWLYRIVIEKVLGLQGRADTLLIKPSIPSHWHEVDIDYQFRGANIALSIKRSSTLIPLLTLDGKTVKIENDAFAIGNIQRDKTYHLLLELPSDESDVKPTVVFVCGVSGSGKSTLAKRLSAKQNAVFVEGDDLHSMQSKSKMARGIPLDENDRAPWIERIRVNLIQKLQHGQSVVLSFSGLKAVHRQLLLEACEAYCSKTTMFFLNTPYNAIEERLSARRDHFFDASLLKSQFDSLQMPHSSENCFVVDGHQSADLLLKLCIAKLQ